MSASSSQPHDLVQAATLGESAALTTGIIFDYGPEEQAAAASPPLPGMTRVTIDLAVAMRCGSCSGLARRALTSILQSPEASRVVFTPVAIGVSLPAQRVRVVLDVLADDSSSAGLQTLEDLMVAALAKEELEVRPSGRSTSHADGAIVAEFKYAEWPAIPTGPPPSKTDAAGSYLGENVLGFDTRADLWWPALPPAGTPAKGIFRATQHTPDRLLLHVRVDGLAPNRTYGLMVHETGDVRDSAAPLRAGDCLLIDSQPVGKLLNATSDAEGRIQFDGLSPPSTASLSINDFIGYVVVLHTLPNDDGPTNTSPAATYAVVARSAGAGENPRLICACDGTPVWRGE
ncbi:hypothetical protein, variant [Fonticula alba]|nr:hypothetical protein, variant [Fonticula alba]KCV71354.1 hypothetical protein, variant [Fonticula alba]|eukprot:XP_009494476.1 hypothetical protein, variant [Fonticula alba]